MTTPDLNVRRSTAAAPIASAAPVEASTPPDDVARLAEDLYGALANAQRIGGDPALCAALRLLGERSGQNKYRNAASVVGGIRLGRAAIDDSEALRRVAAFRPDRHRDAVGLVARQMAGGDAAKAHAIAQRLRQKLRKQALK